MNEIDQLARRQFTMLAQNADCLEGRLAGFESMPQPVRQQSHGETIDLLKPPGIAARLFAAFADIDGAHPHARLAGKSGTSSRPLPPCKKRHPLARNRVEVRFVRQPSYRA